jgi:hypothetical protein
VYSAKKGRGNAVKETISIDGEVLSWEALSEPQWSTDGYMGLRLSVRLAGENLRELIVEFPYTNTQHGRPRSWPHRPKEFKALLEDAVRQAMDAGWDASSRGRPFTFLVPENADDPSRPEHYR